MLIANQYIIFTYEISNQIIFYFNGLANTCVKFTLAVC